MDIIRSEFFDSINISVKKIGHNIQNGLNYNGRHNSAQGASIRKQTLFRLYDTGICQTFDITDIENPSLISTFKLASFQETNHSNGCQFSFREGNELDSTLLYVTGSLGRCFVEKISDTSSTLIQTITIDEEEILQQNVRLNIVCGDDGFLWAFGRDVKKCELWFAKFPKPNLSLSTVQLCYDDIIDFWSEPNYIFEKSVSQSGKIYNGRLYYVFGTETTDRHLMIYNTDTHKKIMDYDLNEDIKEEPEDLEIIGESMFIFINRESGYYLIDGLIKQLKS
jgi:hypothetical protein